jgi:hypothetical protein
MSKDIVSSAKDYVRNLWKDLQPKRPEGTAEKIALEQRVMNDFSLSFKFSQGDLSTHEALLEYTARGYSTRDIIDILNNYSRFDDLLTQLTLPSQHGKVRSKQEGKTPSNVIREEFLHKWFYQVGSFRETLRNSIQNDQKRSKICRNWQTK